MLIHIHDYQNDLFSISTSRDNTIFTVPFDFLISLFQLHSSTSGSTLINKTFQVEQTSFIEI